MGKTIKSMCRRILDALNNPWPFQTRAPALHVAMEALLAKKFCSIFDTSLVLSEEPISSYHYVWGDVLYCASWKRFEISCKDRDDMIGRTQRPEARGTFARRKYSNSISKHIRCGPFSFKIRGGKLASFMLDAGCWMLDAGCWMLNVECSCESGHRGY